MSEVKNKRDQVKECIALGTMNKIEIAEKLGMSVASVATQMTYLRWMDNYIITAPETKILSFTDKDTYEKLEAERVANRKTKPTATRTPEERAVATAKTIATQTDQLDKWAAKVEVAEELLTEHPDDVDAKLNLKEATAMVALLEVKLARNEKLAEDLPEVPETDEEEADGIEPDGLESDGVESDDLL